MAASGYINVTAQTSKMTNNDNNNRCCHNDFCPDMMTMSKRDNTSCFLMCSTFGDLPIH